MSCEDDFYEDDEPVEDIIAAWQASPKGLTKPPVDPDTTEPTET